MPRWAKMIDNSQPLIVEALRKAGRDVIVWNDIFDLIVGYQGFTYILDCKSKETRHGLTDKQKEWVRKWTGGAIAIVYTPEEALLATSLPRAHRPLAPLPETK